MRHGTDISFNNSYIELRSIKSFDASGTLVDDISGLRHGTDISFNNSYIELRSIKSFDASGTLVDDITNLRNGTDISKNQIDYATAYQEVTYQGGDSGAANYIQSSNNTNVITALNNMSTALATLATAVHDLHEKYVIN